MNTFEVIAARRSIKRLEAPAPTDDQLRQMFVAASQAPDHKELTPWQFIVLRDARKIQFGEKLVEALKTRDPNATDGQIEKEQSKPERAPLIVAVVARRMPSSLPFEEMYAAACAATQNFLLAATELGFGTIWRTGGAISDDVIRDWLDIPFGDLIVGFIYIGTAPARAPSERRPVDLTETVIW